MSEFHLEKCKTCNGEGAVEVSTELEVENGMIQTISEWPPCSDCNTTGIELPWKRGGR